MITLFAADVFGLLERLWSLCGRRGVRKWERKKEIGGGEERREKGGGRIGSVGVPQHIFSA